MKVLQSVLALMLVLVLGCATTSTVSAATIEEGASGDLIATLEKARMFVNRPTSRFGKTSN